MKERSRGLALAVLAVTLAVILYCEKDAFVRGVQKAMPCRRPAAVATHDPPSGR